MLNKKQIISYNVQNINRHVFNTLYIWAIVYAERFLYLNFFGFCGIKFSKIIIHQSGSLQNDITLIEHFCLQNELEIGWHFLRQ